MIISASRRTDIPAYYSKWFLNRIREGYCTVPNPFNFEQVQLVDLTPEAVTAIVFWTRNATPILKDLKILDDLGYKYYFQFTINNYGKTLEPYNPSLELSLNSFKQLSEKLGIGKVIWRYDPIVFTDELTIDFHKSNFSKIFNELKNYTKKIVISIIDDYKKTLSRLRKIQVNYTEKQENIPQVEELLKYIVDRAYTENIRVESCAEEKDLSYLGIEHGKCIDDRLLKEEFGIDLCYKKDKNQRLACGCMISKDIGVNNTCLMGCEYCYATSSHKAAINNRKKHNPDFSSLIEHKINDDIKLLIENLKMDKKNIKQQMTLF